MSQDYLRKRSSSRILTFSNKPEISSSVTSFWASSSSSAFLRQSVFNSVSSISICILWSSGRTRFLRVSKSTRRRTPLWPYVCANLASRLFLQVSFNEIQLLFTDPCHHGVERLFCICSILGRNKFVSSGEVPDYLGL